MNRRSVAVFAALSIIVAALAAGSVAYRVLSAESEGRKAAAADFERLAALLADVRSSSDLADEGLRARLGAHYKSAPSLLLVSIYERGAGLRWRIPARSAYLPASENEAPFPEPLYPDRSSLLLSAPVKSDVTGRLAVDALYTTVSQATIFLAFRDAALTLGAYLAVSAAAFAALAAARGKKSGAGRSPAVGAMGPSASAGYSLSAEDEAALAAVPDRDAGMALYAPPEEEFQVPDIEDTAEGDAASGPSRGAAGAELYSPSSGIGWESYQAERLDAELARSASFEQDLSILVLSYDGMTRGSKAYPAVATSLVDFFTFRDLAFERGEDGFTVILPNIDIAGALRMAEEYFKKLTFLLRDHRAPLEFLPVFIGLSSRAGRLVDSSRIMQEATAALQKAREDRDSHIVAFRPDPDKYRLYLASKGC